MRVTCLQESLARSLQIAGRAVSPRTTLAILGNVLLRAEGGRLRVVATNLEIGIECWVGAAKVEDEGRITVPAKLFTEFVNSLPAGQVGLSLNVRTKSVNIKSGPFEANLKGLDAEEFPIMPALPERALTSVAQSVLRRMIHEVAFVAATDDSRPVLTGVLTTFDGGEVTMAAADPYRLSVRRGPLLSPVSEKVEVILPAKSLFEVERILAESDEGVGLYVTPNRSQVIFHTADVDLVSRVIEGQFPNYRQVIPSASQTTVTVQRQELLNATRLASYFARDAANIVRFQIDPSSDTPLVVSAAAAEVGDNTGRIEATVEGQPATIAFNSRFVQEALGSLSANEVKLELGGPLAPGVVKVVGDEEAYLHVVMPLRIPS